MITERDLNEAIAECIGKREPNAQDCIKLAAFYTIKDNLYPSEQRQAEPVSSYTYAGAENIVDHPGESQFAELVDGRPQSEVWPVIDELMVTLEAINPRLYDAVLRKLQ